ncbi:MAG: nickel-binding protein [Rhizobiaceae bacterium]|jgi:class 3 adenylate cyclase
MPIFLDRHEMQGATAADVAAAHLKDLEIQDQYGVRYLTYWFDEPRGSTFCLVDAPNIEAAKKVHEVAHGMVPGEFLQVDLSAVEAFLGRIADPGGHGHRHAPRIDAAHRTIMFTDIVDSTGMTTRLGDARAVEMVRTHDSIVRRSLRETGGREVKHTGDGIMASFEDAAHAAACARAVQSTIAAFNRESSEALGVRIGIHAGEPVEDSNDLFGSTVQMAARLCKEAAPSAILISEDVRGALSADPGIRMLGSSVLKGFPVAVTLYELVWS